MLRRSKQFALSDGPLTRLPLITGPELMTVGVGLALLLALLFPDPRHFEQRIEHSHPDDLAIAYLQNLLLTDRDNLELHLLLAGAQAERLDYYAIERLLAEVEHDGNAEQRRRAKQIRLHALIAAYHAGRPSLPPQEVDVLLHTLAAEAHASADLAFLADSALSLGRTDLALQLYLRIARNDPQHVNNWVKPATLSALVAAYTTGQLTLPPPEIDELLHALALQAHSAAALASLADNALSLGRTELAWLLYLRISQSSPLEYRSWVEPAALRSLGLGHYRFASKLYFLAREGAEREDARRLYAKGVGALMATSRFAEAMTEAERHLGDLANDAPTLRFLVTTARAADDNRHAAEFARRLVAVELATKTNTASKEEGNK